MVKGEIHRIHRIGWLRAAVLGANDGIVSTASLILGVAAASGSRDAIIVAGVAGLVAGAMSMAAGEYVSVSSQADTESADLSREKQELEDDYDHELQELTAIYQGRGLEQPLAAEVALQLMKHDALGAHARDELGLVDALAANPIQAGLSSAATFAFGALLPLALVWLFPMDYLMIAVATGSLVFLATLGAVSAYVGGAPLLKAVSRVTFWGALAMLITAAVGALFGVAA